MDTVLTRIADAPLPAAPTAKLSVVVRALYKHLAAMVSATAEGLVRSQPDPAPTWYRFPPF